MDTDVEFKIPKVISDDLKGEEDLRRRVEEYILFHDPIFIREDWKVSDIKSDDRFVMVTLTKTYRGPTQAMWRVFAKKWGMKLTDSPTYPVYRAMKVAGVQWWS